MRISNEWLDYLERPLWSGTLGVCLMYGYTDSEFQKKRESASFDATVRAIEEKIELLGADTIHLKEYFSHVIHNGEYFYQPKVFIEWAIHRRLPVPNELKEFLKSHNKTSEHVRAAMESLEAQPEPLSTYGLSEYLKHRKWTALQAIFILHGMKPQGTDENTRDELQTHFIQAYSYLEQDAFTADEGEHLKPKIIGAGVTTCCETPEFWFRWAVSKGLPIDERITKHFKTIGEQAEPLANVGGEKQGGTEQTNSKAIQPNSNEFAFSGLLHIPSGNDDWFEVIDVMTKAFYEKNKAMPTKAQAWAQLCTNPPDDYAVTFDKNKDGLIMPEITKAFKKRSFDRRWAKYTAKSNPYKTN